MSTDIGTLMIQLQADTAQLRRDMDDAKTMVGGAMQDIQRAIDVAKGALIAFVGIASVEAFRGMVEGNIKAAAAMDALTVKTGATAEALSGLATVGKMTGTSASDIADMMTKLAKNTAGITDESKGAGAALAGLGINVRDFQSLTPDQKMKALADAMSGFQDGSEKSAYAMAILGKSGAEALPYMKNLADVGDLVAKQTTEQTRQAKEYELAMARLNATQEAWKKQVSMAMLPALDEAAKAMLAVTGGTNGWNEEIKKLAADGSITRWTRDAITGITYVMDAFSGLAVVAKSAGLLIGGAFAAIAAHNPTQLRAVIQGIGEDLDKAWSDKTLGQNLRDRMEQMQQVGTVAEAQRPKLDATKLHGENAQAAKDYAKAIDALNSTIEAHIRDGEQQLHSTTKLTEAQKIQNKLEADLTNGKLAMTDAQRQHTQALIDHLQQVDRDLAAKEADKQFFNQITKLREEAALAAVKHTEALQKENEKLIDQIYQAGMTREEYARLTVTRTLDQAATLELTAADSAQSEELLKQAQILRERAALLQEGIVVREARAAADEWKRASEQIGCGLSSSIIGAMEQGKGAWVGFRDYMVKVILDGILKNALASVITDGINSTLGSVFGIARSGSSSATGSVLSSVFSSGTGSNAATGSVVSNGFSTVGSVGTVGSQVLTGGMSVPNAAGTIYANATGQGLDGLFATNAAYGTATTGAEAAATAATAGTATESAAAASAGTEALSGLGSAVPYIGAMLLVGGALGMFSPSKQLTPAEVAAVEAQRKQMADYRARQDATGDGYGYGLDMSSFFEAPAPGTNPARAAGDGGSGGGGGGGSGGDSVVVQEISQLRAESKAQALAMANFMSRFTKIVDQWDKQGMPAVRST